MSKFKVGERVATNYKDPRWFPDVVFKITIIDENYNKKGRNRYYGVDARGVIHGAWEEQLTLVPQEGE